MKIFIYPGDGWVRFRMKSYNSKFFEIDTDMTIQEILYYKDFLVYVDEILQVKKECPLPMYSEESTIIYAENIRDKYYSFPGYDYLLTAPIVIPKKSVIVESTSPYIIIAEAIKWDGDCFNISPDKNINIILKGDDIYESL